MFKAHYGYCKYCNQDDQLIVVKSGHCERCNYKKKQAKRKSEGKKTGKYQYVREASGEGEMFAEIALNQLPDEITTCFVCKTPIAVVTHHNMAHVLPKGKYPKFRLNPDNIKILCHNFMEGKSCHSIWDTKPRSEIKDNPEWQEMFELETQLKEEYKRITE